jgi:hypothetical protein
MHGARIFPQMLATLVILWGWPAMAQAQDSTPPKPPTFSSGGMTVRLVSISANKAAHSIALSMLVENDSATDVLATLVASAGLIDNRGNSFAPFGNVDGFSTCQWGQPLANSAKICAEMGGQMSPEQYTSIDKGSSAIVNMNMVTRGTELGDVVTFAGAMVIIASGDSGGLTAKDSKPKGKLINIALPLIPLH